jgi:hypothetical protein
MTRDDNSEISAIAVTPFRQPADRAYQGVEPHSAEISMLMILLATCETTQHTLRAADNPVDAELLGLLSAMILRTRAALDQLTDPRPSHS